MGLNARIVVEDGEIGLHLAGAEGPPRPGIVLLPEIFGANDAMELAARGFADAGFVVAVVDLYRRIAPGTALSYRPEDRQRALELWAALNDEKAVSDINRVIAWLRRQSFCTGRVAALGFCLGGKLAILSGLQDQPDAVVAFYPVGMVAFADRLASIRCPVQVHLGDQDEHVPEAVVALLRDELCRKPQDEFHKYHGTGHGFYNSVRAFGFHAEHAARAHTETLRFLSTVSQTSARIGEGTRGP